ncbi:MAG: histidinol-phosphatase HisJ family protein [Anaerolineae bacterium]|nr:histidinol-phosphatase HisJ family protein [Anaerolineae bacterium]
MVRCVFAMGTLGHEVYMLVDYHCHTCFSQDSKASMAEQCQAALQRRLHQIAFTEHEDYNPDDPTSFYFRHEAYLREVERCRQAFGTSLVIRAGIEISEPHRHAARAGRVLAEYPWDFVLGSLHWVTPEVDSYRPQFFTTWCDGDWRLAFRRYFTEMIALARDGDFDVLAHLDYPARYGKRYFGDEYDIGEFEDLVREALSILIARGKGIEINTSPWRKGAAHPNPPQVVLSWYREMGGTVLTIGSDAHAPQEVGADMSRALALARAAGFTHITLFEQRKPTFVPIANDVPQPNV